MFKQDFYNIWKFDPLVDKSCIYPWNRPGGQRHSRGLAERGQEEEEENEQH